MARTCTVCRHPSHELINAALIAESRSLRNLADEHGLSASALRRHKLEHIPSLLLKSKEADELTEAASLAEHVRGLQSRSLKILQKAEAAGDLRTSLVALRELRGIVELVTRLSAQDGVLIEVAVVEQYVQNVMEVLRDFVPADRLDAALAKLKQVTDAEALGAREETPRAPEALPSPPENGPSSGPKNA